VNSWIGCFSYRVSRQRSGVRKSYVFCSAAKVACAQAGCSTCHVSCTWPTVIYLHRWSQRKERQSTECSGLVQPCKQTLNPRHVADCKVLSVYLSNRRVHRTQVTQ